MECSVSQGGFNEISKNFLVLTDKENEESREILPASRVRKEVRVLQQENVVLEAVVTIEYQFPRLLGSLKVSVTFTP